ncbi:hypothetical protein BZL30_7410 [Mycobacterium kansasii]|uniref:Transmembrane protein n=1 Tax=Mycobacterium kansasii TaxID=1768 RepID=A0A1V3WRY3_MYCKA|nr:hypothetical protein BZL30_7410 [Mycobacterium kansasii]
MTGPHSDTEDTKQISVAELLARNGTIGAPAVTRRRRRRRGDSDSVTVAELTGEIPIIREDRRGKAETPAPTVPAEPPSQPKPGKPRVEVAEPARPSPPEPEPVAAEPAAEEPAMARYWSEPEPRWPRSEPIARRKSGPERSEYPRPLRHTEEGDTSEQQSGAEHMSPDPVGHYVDSSVEAIDVAVDEAEPVADETAYARSYLHDVDGAAERTLFGGQSLADEVAGGGARHPRRCSTPSGSTATVPTKQVPAVPGALVALWRGTVVVLQSIMAVIFGAGLFIAFDQLWRWNSIVALVLSVLVILGLVVAVRVVRKTEDIASTLIAVAVGALITWGPLVLSLQTG